MLRNRAGILVALFFMPTLSAQKGTAPNGYYPYYYQGDTFTGRLESVNDSTQEMTLVYRKGAKAEPFLGRLESSCGWTDAHRNVHTFRASDIPMGTVLTAFYTVEAVKSAGQAPENMVFAIKYVEMFGKKLPDSKIRLISCSPLGFGTFKPFR
jgi:hypothetical protein